MRFRFVVSAQLVLALMGFTGAGAASQRLDVKAMLDWGWAQSQCTPLDIGQVSDAFDGSAASLIRTPGINPLVLTLNFSEAQCVDGFRIWFLGGDNQWQVEGAATLADLDGQNTNSSYRLLIPPRTEPESQWNIAGLGKPQTVKVLRLTLSRLTGDGYVHLCEWEIDHWVSLQLLSTGTAATGQVRWGTEPCGLYMLQSSRQPANWDDQEYAST